VALWLPQDVRRVARGVDDAERTNRAVHQMEGKRLTLVGPDPKQEARMRRRSDKAAQDGAQLEFVPRDNGLDLRRGGQEALTICDAQPDILPDT